MKATGVEPPRSLGLLLLMGDAAARLPLGTTPLPCAAAPSRAATDAAANANDTP